LGRGLPIIPRLRPRNLSPPQFKPPPSEFVEVSGRPSKKGRLGSRLLLEERARREIQTTTRSEARCSFQVNVPRESPFSTWFPTTTCTTATCPPPAHSALRLLPFSSVDHGPFSAPRPDRPPSHHHDHHPGTLRRFVLAFLGSALRRPISTHSARASHEP